MELEEAVVERVSETFPTDYDGCVEERGGHREVDVLKESVVEGLGVVCLSGVVSVARGSEADSG